MAMLKLPYLDSAESGRNKHDACGSCLGRREFLRVGLGATVAAAALATLPEALAAAPVRWISAVGGDDEPRYPVPQDDGVHIDRDKEIILVRYKGMIAAFALSCPHQRAMLHWRQKDQIFRCSKHHSEYSPTGVYLKGRATRNMDRYAISIQNGQVVVDKSTVFHSDDDPQGWAAAEVPAP